MFAMQHVKSVNYQQISAHLANHHYFFIITNATRLAQKDFMEIKINGNVFNAMKVN